MFGSVVIEQENGARALPEGEMTTAVQEGERTHMRRQEPAEGEWRGAEGWEDAHEASEACGGGEGGVGIRVEVLTRDVRRSYVISGDVAWQTCYIRDSRTLTRHTHVTRTHAHSHVTHTQVNCCSHKFSPMMVSSTLVSGITNPLSLVSVAAVATFAAKHVDNTDQASHRFIVERFTACRKKLLCPRYTWVIIITETIIQIITKQPCIFCSAHLERICPDNLTLVFKKYLECNLEINGI